VPFDVWRFGTNQESNDDFNDLKIALKSGLKNCFFILPRESYALIWIKRAK
jgi:hypothetical protein